VLGIEITTIGILSAAVTAMSRMEGQGLNVRYPDIAESEGDQSLVRKAPLGGMASKLR
jgi:hypothetical protein